MHRIGANPDEHQRLGMLGTLERQNVEVSRHSAPRLFALIPSSDAIGLPWFRHEPAPRQGRFGTCPQTLGIQDRIRCAMTTSNTPFIRHPFIVLPCSNSLPDLTATQSFNTVVFSVSGLILDMDGVASCWQMEQLLHIFRSRDSPIARSLLT